ncbi:MAG: NAD(P)(+) transhydrogenase (Re/Si-specific) subunit alpha, partial [Cyanobacteria bacterium J06648_1]
MTATVDRQIENNQQPENSQPGPRKIGVPKEIYNNECRVAATPNTVKKLQKLGFEVLIESNAGAAASFTDQAYQEADCTIVPDAASLWSQADIILKVRAPEDSEIQAMPHGKTIISFIWPAQNEELLNKLAERKATVIAMDSVPRISRAQKMDALSSMAN